MPGSTIVPSPITAALAPIAGTSWGLYAGQNAGAGGEVKADGDAARGAAAPAADPVAVQIPTFAPAGGVGGGELLDLNELFGGESGHDMSCVRLVMWWVPPLEFSGGLAGHLLSTHCGASS
jgi:hypothetical protein